MGLGQCQDSVVENMALSCPWELSHYLQTSGLEVDWVELETTSDIPGKRFEGNTVAKQSEAEER